MDFRYCYDWNSGSKWTKYPLMSTFQADMLFLIFDLDATKSPQMAAGYVQTASFSTTLKCKSFLLHSTQGRLNAQWTHAVSYEDDDFICYVSGAPPSLFSSHTILRLCLAQKQPWNTLEHKSTPINLSINNVLASNANLLYTSGWLMSIKHVWTASSKLIEPSDSKMV